MPSGPNFPTVKHFLYHAQEMVASREQLFCAFNHLLNTLQRKDSYFVSRYSDIKAQIQPVTITVMEFSDMYLFNFDNIFRSCII